MIAPYYLDEYRFCPLCSGKVVHKKGLVECKKCEYRIFDNAIPCVNVIIENDRKEILLVERSIEPFKGWLDLPGGFISSGESMESAAIREVKEEIGVSLKVKEIIGNFLPEYEYQNLIYKLLVFVVSGTVGSRSFVVGDDVSEIKLVKKDKILDEKICFPEVNKKALKKYLSRT